MNDYRIRIELTSSAGTRWQSDTIFGHLCWQVAYGGLAMTIEEFLRPFLEGSPPFVLSDGFPVVDNPQHGEIHTMPRPMVNIAVGRARTVSEYADGKRRRKSPFYCLEDFLGICRGEAISPNPVSDPWRIMVMPHASLDRNSFTTKAEGEGGLFETISEYLPPPSIIEVYVRCEEGWIDRVMKLFELMAHAGFGRDKSVGAGAFQVQGVEEVDCFKHFDDANGFVSLSSMVPAKSDPTDARYRLRVKYGKLGEGGHDNPFKRPLLQMEPGAVFKTEDGLRHFYGRMVTGIVHGNDDVVQNCYCLPAPCRIN